MPRPRVRDEDRKRVARACDTCKRRKEKCNGDQPCLLCKRRGREPECIFSEGSSRRGSSRNSVAGGTNATTNATKTKQASKIATSSQAVLDTTLAQGPPSSNTDAEIAIESLLTLSGSRSAPKTPPGGLVQPSNIDDSLAFTDSNHNRENDDSDMNNQGNVSSSITSVAHTRPNYNQHHRNSSSKDATSRAPVPKLARLLRDGHGKFIFVGDSSNLAFVQNIRRLVKSEIGDSSLTTDPLRHAMVEATPIHRHYETGPNHSVPKPSLNEANELVKAYLLVSSGVIDLFDPDEIANNIRVWASGPSSSPSKVDKLNNVDDEAEFNSSIYYLVLAIGAQTRNSGHATSIVGSNSVSSKRKDNSDQNLAELYLSHGRELVASSFMDDPSVLTIQAYALITFYMLSACRRNGAFMLLGIAVRAAYALGLHRNDISRLFDHRERKTRERVWKSLRVLDLYMSASLGRPPATSEVDGGSVSWDRSSRDYEAINMSGLNASAMLRICFIFERIMNEVYCRREVSVQLVESISRQYRDWTLQLPAGLHIDGLDQKAGEGAPSLSQTIGIAHLKGSYYWSIILLTRPFLIFMVSSKIKSRSSGEEEEQRSDGVSSVTSTLSEACIDAALRGIEIATDLIYTPGVPRRLFMVTNSTFVSAMVIGFAIFGDFDKTFPLMSSIDQAEAILALMAKDDPSARRYEQITGHLRQAAAEHIRRRDQQRLQRRRQDINNIFGDPIKEALETSKPTSHAHILIPQDVPDLDGANETTEQQDLPWQLRFDMPPESRGPVLTTSGALASTDDNSGQAQYDFSNYGFEQNTGLDSFSPSGSGIPSLPSYADEFPLFSLMTDFDQSQDPFQMGVT